MTNDRRNFVKGAAAGTAGVVGALSGTNALAQKKPQSLNPNAKAVLPDGALKDRKEILTQLGLDPTTSPEAWLAIVACGSNASALKQDQLKNVIDKGMIKKQQLDKVSLQKLKQQ